MSVNPGQSEGLKVGCGWVGGGMGGWSVCEVWVEGWIEGGSKGFEFARRMREKVRGEYRLSSLMKQKKRGKIALSFTSPEKENYLFIIFK